MDPNLFYATLRIRANELFGTNGRVVVGQVLEMEDQGNTHRRLVGLAVGAAASNGWLAMVAGLAPNSNPRDPNFRMIHEIIPPDTTNPNFSGTYRADFGDMIPGGPAVIELSPDGTVTFNGQPVHVLPGRPESGN